MSSASWNRWLILQARNPERLAIIRAGNYEPIIISISSSLLLTLKLLYFASLQLTLSYTEIVITAFERENIAFLI